MKHTFSAPFAVGLVMLALAGCGSGTDQDAADTISASEAPALGEIEVDGPDGVEVDSARLALPAVAGNPGAVYFTITNDSDTDLAIASVAVTGAGMASMHRSSMQGNMARMQDTGELALPAGGSVTFQPGGLHVMAMDLADTLEDGGSTEVTLSFTDGDKASFPVTIVSAGDSLVDGPGEGS